MQKTLYEWCRQNCNKFKRIVEPDIINDLAKSFGSQAVVSSIQAKK